MPLKEPLLPEPSDPLMSVAEFRRVAGSDTDGFSDEQIAEYIQQFDLLAQMHIKSVIAREEEADGVA